MFKVPDFVNLVVFIVFFLIQKSISAQNQAPKFEPPLQSNYFFSEFNSTKPGDILLWLNATDYDDNDLQFGVESDFYKKLITIKKIDGKHAMVLANQKFDREVQEKYENIVFFVKDKPGNKVYQSVRFVILDIDDNPPIFKNTPYKIDVLENQPVDTIIFDYIEAFDADGPLYNKFSFSLTNNNDNRFAIDKANYLSSGLYSSSIILKQKLDYEKEKNHVLTITAIGENSLFTASTDLLINVIDYPDRKPEFSQSPYYVRISEELKIGEFVLQVSAKDGDTGINNPCKYEITSDSHDGDYFKIDSSTGIISLNKRIDLESNEIIKLGGLLEFNVVAIEIGDESSFQQTKVTVAILDINDNSPVFNKQKYNLNISPKSTIGTSLTLVDNEIDSMHVLDLDKGINGSFSLTLSKVLNKNGNSVVYESMNDFEIVPKIALNDANLIIKLKNPLGLLKKIGLTEHYHLLASDNGINGKIVYADVYIKIENINEYAPQFDKKIYTFYVDENSPFDTTVGYLKAIDNDTFGDYGKISYELKNGQERFQIDKNTGRIYTISENPSEQLDRELIDTYFMSVDAIDGAGLRTSAQLVIKLNDLNDNAPQFTNNLFNLNGLSNSTNSSNILIGYIEENSSNWIESIKLQAIDRDIGLNGAIEYDIIDGDCFKDYFRINKKTNRIVLRENLTLDFEEIYRLKQKNAIELNRISMPKDVANLILNPGEIDLNLIIVARDLGSPSLSSKIVAKIIIKDVNDNKPKFEKNLYSAQVLETARFGDVFQVTAFDLDAPNTANSKIIYGIESGNKDKFSIDSTNGMVRINENSNLDRDLFGSSYTLRIIANDFDSINSKSIKNNSDENSCYLVIKIIDVNNKKPQIQKNFELINVQEDIKINTKLTQIKAIDLDLNSNLTFFLINNDSTYNNSIFDGKMEAFDENNHNINFNLVKNWFDIDSLTGVIFSKNTIDREIAETVQLVIGVEDLNAANDFKPQISSTLVKIKITDVNDNFPTFLHLRQLNSDHNLAEGEEPLFEMFENLDENTKINTKIAQLKVFDIDKDNNVTFKIIHSTDFDKSLAINKHTGEIFVKSLIDYETKSWINLTILVNDNGSPAQKHSILHFYCKINDLNDNSPKFVQLNTTELEIFENNKPHFFINKFKAIDYDSGDFGTVTYRVLSGDEEKFEINSITGELFAKSVLDREEQQFYTLVIQARDNPSGSSSNQLSDSVLIKIKILDLNDNKPYCEQNEYKIETVQNVDVGTILHQIKAFDNDIGKNSMLKYSLKSNNEFDGSDDLFEINSINGQIKTKKKLIGYSGSYKYNLILFDNEGIPSFLSGSCNVEIIVKDVNMHIPKFVYPDTNNSIRRIKASIPFGAYLLTVNATDEDNGPNGEIVYYLDEKRFKNDDWKSFNLDSKTGVLTLNTKLNLNHQSIYSIDIIASDMGRPTQLQSRFTLTLIIVDDSNNSAKFNRMDICLAGNYQCEKNYQTVLVKLKEQQDPKLSLVYLNLAKTSDITKTDLDICYYLIGKDKNYFRINKTSGVLSPIQKLDREIRDKFDIVIKASEYCLCPVDSTELVNDFDEKQCAFMKLSNENIDSSDISLLKVKVIVEDINDNIPKFQKKFYQIGITSDIDFGETLLESFANDLDVNSTLNFAILNKSFISNFDKKYLPDKHNKAQSQIPFSLEFSDTQLVKNNSNVICESKFMIKTQQYFKEQNYLNEINKNIYFQFNITVSDQDYFNDTAVIQIILINKQQRVKLVFSQSIDKVVKFQEEFQNYISNLTGFRAYIDKINVHRTEDDESFESLANQHSLTDMLLHFVEPNFDLFKLDSVNASNRQYTIVDAETILSILDRSKDSNLLKKYKLSLAEKYDDQGSSTFYKYGSAALEDDFGSFFLLSTSTTNNSNFLTKLFFTFLFIVLVFCSTSTFIICFCMRHKYKRKLKAERAMVKAFGLEQRSLSYNDAISGYINHGFDSNSLLPIPGTNLYAYEGSNPIWLKKYDKIDAQNNGSSCSSSTTDSNDASNNPFNLKDNQITKPNLYSKDDLNKSQDISSFYLKQIDSTSTTSRCSPAPSSNNTDKTTTKNQNITLTSDILSVQDLSPIDFDQKDETKINNNENKNLTSFKTEPLLTFVSSTQSNNSNNNNNNNTNNNIITPTSVSTNNLNNTNQVTNSQGGEVFSFRKQIELLSNQRFKLNLGKNLNNKPQSIMFPNSSNNFTKIFEYQQTEQQPPSDNITTSNQSVSKDINDLFAEESTVI